MAKHFEWGSVEHQKDVAKSLGYDPNQYDPSDDVEVSKLANLCLKALFSGRDASGKQLNPDDLELLSRLTGRG